MTGALVRGGWDCHGHVFGPYEKYPLSEPRVYTPPSSPIESYLAHLKALGLDHGVLVQPSAYGTDDSLLMDTLAAFPQLRGVVVPAPGSAPAFAGLHDRGVRGARFSHRSVGNFPGAPGIEDLVRLAPALADAGMHAELWTDCEAMPTLRETLTRLPVTVVLDHMGGFKASRGVLEPGFEILLQMVREGAVWVKLCAYRNLLDAPDFEIGQEFQRALQDANFRQMVWGSDWPYLRVSPAPSGLQLLEAVSRWSANADLVQAVLVDNPAALYA